MKTKTLCLVFLFALGCVQINTAYADKKLIKVELMEFQLLRYKVADVRRASQQALAPIFKKQEDLADRIEKRLKIKLIEYTINQNTGVLTEIKKEKAK